MTRQEIVADYTVDAHGVIQSPGKFEGEMLYAVAAYDVMMSGGTEIMDWPGDNRTDIIDVDEEFRKEFPEIDNETVALALEESDQGFVYCKQYDQRMLDELHSENDLAWENETTDAE